MKEGTTVVYCAAEPNLRSFIPPHYLLVLQSSKEGFDWYDQKASLYYTKNIQKLFSIKSPTLCTVRMKLRNNPP